MLGLTHFRSEQRSLFITLVFPMGSLRVLHLYIPQTLITFP